MADAEIVRRMGCAGQVDELDDRIDAPRVDAQPTDVVGPVAGSATDIDDRATDVPRPPLHEGEVRLGDGFDGSQPVGVLLRPRSV